MALGSTAISAVLNGIHSNTASLSVSPPVLTAIAITPGSATLAKGMTAGLTALGTYSDGSIANVTGIVSWTSAAQVTASVGNTTGIVTGVAPGTTTVKAFSNGVFSPAANITVTAAILISISVTPATTSIPQGKSTQFTATGTYSDGTSGNISGSVTWDYTPLMTVLDAGSGNVTGGAVGVTYVNASLNGVASNTAQLTVTPAVVESISVAANPGFSVAVSGTTFLSATATYSDGTMGNLPTPNTPATWISLDTGFVTVSQLGRVTGVAMGVGTISVTADDVTVFVQVIVNSF